MIGALTHKIEMQVATRIDDAGGGATVQYLPGPELWAQIERLRSTRDFTGDRVNRLKRIAAGIRQRSDIVLGQQLVFDNDAYEIVSIEDGADAHHLTLVCEEVKL